jgi:hypothetical protein
MPRLVVRSFAVSLDAGRAVRKRWLPLMDWAFATKTFSTMFGRPSEKQASTTTLPHTPMTPSGRRSWAASFRGVEPR